MKKIMLVATAYLVLSSVIPIMAAGNAAAGKSKAAVCAACHGADGNSPSNMFPKMAGQGEAYLLKQLTDFKSGIRKNAIMQPMIAALTEQDMADLAAYFSGNKTTEGGTPKEFLEDGQALYRGGNKATGVPACMACHGPTGAGIPAAKWPALSGQHASYIEAQLNAFASGTRSNDPNKMMRDIATKMTANEIKAVAAYASGLH